MQQHRMHALCPYFAMFPPEFAREAILRHTKPGDLVLDPFSGRGTTLLEAVLLGRRAIASDINPVAFCISSAKAHPPSLGRILARIDTLEMAHLRAKREGRRVPGLPKFFHWAFHPDTLDQIIFMRKRLRWKCRGIDRFVAALMLGHLHGEADHSPNFFSNQMPHTISTKPVYSVRYWRERRLRPPRRDVFAILRDRAAFRLAQGRPLGDARVVCSDARDLSRRLRNESRRVSAVITSPPYLDVTSFEEDQWLRLWFLGGPPQPTAGTCSRDDRHRSELNYWRFLVDSWEGVAPLLRKHSIIVCRVGSRRHSHEELAQRVRQSLKEVWPHVSPMGGAVVSQLRGSRATLMHAESTGCQFELDLAYRVS
ncbi:MAG: DNA methylase [Acidobacteria bacterium]|nr:DNA methylase [Acidobacteriota bacterium]